MKLLSPVFKNLPAEAFRDVMGTLCIIFVCALNTSDMEIYFIALFYLSNCSFLTKIKQLEHKQEGKLTFA